MMRIAGEVLIILGVLFMLFGVIGLFKFRRFYPRVLIAAKIDTVGLITIFLGVAVRHGFSFFTLRLLLLLGLVLLTNPMTTYIIARFANLSGYKPESDETSQTITNDREA